jgi:hypothetical protein
MPTRLDQFALGSADKAEVVGTIDGSVWVTPARAKCAEVDLNIRPRSFEMAVVVIFHYGC